MRFGLGDLVQISNPKHKHYGALGTIVRMDRGNVHVELQGSQFDIVTRMTALGEPPPLTQIARAAGPDAP
jgi:hypothetical protein